MVYRASQADRVAEIEALIASEPEVVAERARLRYLHDEVAERIDKIEVADAEAARGGLRGMFRSKKTKEAEAAWRHNALAEAKAQLEALAVTEREVEAKMRAIAEARREVAGREVSAVDSVRTADGPDGEAIRAVDVSIAEGEYEIAKLNALLALGERAVDGVRQVAETRAQALEMLAARRFSQSDALFDALVPMIHNARDAVAKLRSAPWADVHGFEASPARLAGLLDEVAPRDPRDSRIAHSAQDIATILEEQVTALFEARKRIEARRATPRDYQREIAARGTTA